MNFSEETTITSPLLQDYDDDRSIQDHTTKHKNDMPLINLGSEDSSGCNSSKSNEHEALINPVIFYQLALMGIDDENSYISKRIQEY